MVGPNAPQQSARLQKTYLRLQQVCELIVRQLDPTQPGWPESEVDRIEIPSAFAPTTVFVCVNDDDGCLRAAIQVRRALAKRTDITVVVCTTGNSGVASLIRMSEEQVPPAERDLPPLREFALLDMVCRRHVLTDDRIEKLALATHANYLRNRRLEGKGEEDRAMKSWDRLNDELQTANRDAARGIDSLLGSVGYEVAGADEWDAPSVQFKPEEVETMARLEHTRWQRDMLKAGWREGPRSNGKVSPYLRADWTALPLNIQDIDRQFARDLPAILASEGYRVVRKSDSWKDLAELAT